MTILQCCMRYFPNRGGSETYTSALMHGLKKLGITSIVANGAEPVDVYEHEGIVVHRLGYPQVTSVNSPAPHEVADPYSQRLAEMIRETKPDVVHFHFHPGGHVNELLASLRRLDVPLVLTFHHPGMICLRGDLLRFEKDVCSGVYGIRHCLPCYAKMLGAPKAVAEVLPFVPAAVQSGAASALPAGSLKTALSLRGHLSGRFADTREYLQYFDRIVVLSDWSRDILAANGVDAKKIQVSRLGTHHPMPPPATRPPKKRGEVVRGVFVGRLHAVKGVQVVAEALKQIPDVPVSLDVYGPLEDADAVLRPYLEMPADSPVRLCFKGRLADKGVVDTIKDYDFAVVCSQFLETGPYVVIEAFQAGLPVLGTDVPAINELVRHGETGWLVPLHDVASWCSALRKVAEQPELLDTWRGNISQRRSMDDVAAEMADIYRQVLQARKPGAFRRWSEVASGAA